MPTLGGLSPCSILLKTHIPQNSVGVVWCKHDYVPRLIFQSHTHNLGFFQSGICDSPLSLALGLSWELYVLKLIGCPFYALMKGMLNESIKALFMRYPWPPISLPKIDFPVAGWFEWGRGQGLIDRKGDTVTFIRVHGYSHACYVHLLLNRPWIANILKSYLSVVQFHISQACTVLTSSCKCCLWALRKLWSCTLPCQE